MLQHRQLLTFGGGVQDNKHTTARLRRCVPQVSTSDGRVKVLGQAGVEGLLVSALLDPAPTQQLLFARNRGGLVRLDQVGAEQQAQSCGMWPCVYGLLFLSQAGLKQYTGLLPSSALPPPPAFSCAGSPAAWSSSAWRAWQHMQSMQLRRRVAP